MCPEGCLDGMCISDATTGGLRCQRCQNNLVVNKVDGSCMCPAGKYSTGGNKCTDCPKAYYCPGGMYNSSALPAKYACPDNMTTLVMRTAGIRACVNQPGFYYAFTVDMIPYAVQCPADTYTTGLKKQRQCVPCPTGFTTNGVVGVTTPNACIVPAGYYLKAPGQVAPCPRGEWKSGIGTNASCTKCAFGVMTPAEASISADNCSLVVEGYYPAAFSAPTITATKVCPQKYYCPGGKPTQAFNAAAPAGLSAGEPTIKLCPDGTWTVEVGSVSPDQCLTPPGYYTSGGLTRICDAGSYRADWKPASQASSCTSCGGGVFADRTDVVTAYNIITNEPSPLSVTTAADDCYIKQGQGLYYTATTGTWRARNCDTNNYGVSNKTYGLTPYACRDCPTGMMTSTDAANYPNSASWYVNNGDSTGGFTNVKACVTQAGYGYNGRIAQLCDQGKYNPRDSYGDCSSCTFGLTTAAVGAGATVADCGVALGYGYVNGALAPCPLGTYNNNTWVASKTAACTACPFGTTTPALGADSAAMCNLCIGGYGGANCATQCGGRGATATYGVPGREIGTECTPCTDIQTGFSFEWNFNNDIFSPLAISRPAAAASLECLSEYAQIVDGAWYLPTTGDSGMAATAGLSFAQCVDLCSANAQCQYVTYDYPTSNCQVRTAQPNIDIGMPLIAFKAMPSGDVGTNAWSKRKSAEGGAGASGTASGQYSFWQEPNALDVGTQTAPAGAGSFTTIGDCMGACDVDTKCTGFTILMRVLAPTRPTTCKLIYGVRQLGLFKRSVTRAHVSRLAIPSLT